jgi:glycosyltransferase involved in cell wall biosynthesis
MPSWPDVSVVVPTRGRPDLVRQTVATVVAQSYPGRVECLVVHDQEDTDPSLNGLGRGDHTVTVMTNHRVPGLAGARNSGVDVATGAFVATLDDDDLWHETKLAKQVARFEEQPDLLAVASGIRLLLPGDRIVEWPARTERISYRLLLRNRVKELHSSTLVMRRDAYAKAGQYDEGLPRGYAEDYDWVLRLARVGRIGAVTEPLADIRKDVQSWYQGRAENTLVGLEYFWAKHQDEIKASRRGHARMLGQIAYAKSTLGDRRGAVASASRALSHWPVSPHAYLALGHAATGMSPDTVLKGARLFGRGMP